MSRRRREIGVLALVFATLGAGAILLRQSRPRELVRMVLTSAVRPAPACEDGLKSCEGRCLPVDDPAHGCAAEGCGACVTDNATARCDTLRMCAVDSCHKGFADCDANRNNGCETNLLVDPDHCGGCEAVCPPLPHAERGCGGFCTIWRCENGFRDCDAVAGNGCERDVRNDARHCGRCQHTCGPGQRCAYGRCA